MKKSSEVRKEVAEYAEAIAKERYGGSEKWVKYFKSDVGFVVKTESGHFIALEKEQIKKDFCFGYSLSSYDSKSYDDANDMADVASKDVDYFMEVNMRDINRDIERVKNERNKVFSRIRYWGAPADSKFWSYELFDAWDVQEGKVPKECVEVSENDRDAIIEGLEYIKADLEKRCSSYLKKYGLSKVRTWTYWKDE